MIPQLTQPEIKFIRTLEGKLIVFINLLLSVATLVVNLVTPNAHLLPPVTVAKILALVNMVAMMGRSLLKAVLAIQAKTPQISQSPLPVSFGTSNVSGGLVSGGSVSDGEDFPVPVDDPQQEINRYFNEVDAIQSEPGTPANQVKTGLSPSPEPKKAPVKKATPARKTPVKKPPVTS